MRILVVIIALFFAFSQVAVGKKSFSTNNWAMVDSGSQNQNSPENDSNDSDDEEIVSIPANCQPVNLITEPEETIYLHTNHLKSQFFFSFWRPPRYSFSELAR